MGNREAELCGIKEREEACDPLSPPHSSHSLSPCRRGIWSLGGDMAKRWPNPVCQLRHCPAWPEHVDSQDQGVRGSSGDC